MNVRLRHAKLPFQIVSMFSNPIQLIRYVGCMLSRKRKKEIAIKVKMMNGRPLICRTGTSDATVLRDTFSGLYHLPRHPLHPAATIVDLGANVGYVAAHYAELYPDAHILGVELDPNNAEMARRNLDQYGSRCSVLTAAIWWHEGTVQYGGTREHSFKVIQDTGQLTPQGDNAIAKAMTMDNVLDILGVDRIDFLKVDIEGAEFEIFRNSPSWLMAVDSINVEIHDGDRIDEIGSALRSSGFIVERDHLHWCQLIGTRG